MGLPQAPSSPHLYPQALQLKLYQAFIFSIPILFSIILFLLFYLFYLKRRASSLSSTPRPYSPGSSNQATTSNLPPACQLELTKELKNNLPIVLFDEELRRRDSQCCVCLGEFEMKEALLQIPACKHVFHIECIHHWLQSNCTCPLCRCFVVPIATTTIKIDPQASNEPTSASQEPVLMAQDNAASVQQYQLQVAGVGSSEHYLVIPIQDEASTMENS